MILTFNNTEVLRDNVNSNTVNEFVINNPNLWSAENPNIYNLYVVVSKGNQEIEAISQVVGFKHIEIKNGVFYLNNQNIKLKGINRHDFHYKNGWTVTLDEMENDILLLKRFNNNCIRTSHYPNDPRFLELCDRYGMYLIDEADLETHGATWMNNWSYFSENPEWENAFIDRVSRMVYRDRNHPCIVMWSLGNESGWIRNHKICNDLVKKLDKKIPVHYEGAIYDECKGFDVVSMMYPDFNEIKKHLENREEQPFFLCEYTHGQGNCPGGLEEHWEIIYSNDKALGGCVWQMCDHSAIVFKDDGTVKYKYGYGGDFKEGINDGIRGANGFFDPERVPRNAAYMLKQVYRPIRAKLLEKNNTINIEFQNMQDFLDSSDIEYIYELLENGIVVEKGKFDIQNILPHQKTVFTLAIKNEMKDKNEYLLNIYYNKIKSTSYCNAGFDLGFEQFSLSKFNKICFKNEKKDNIVIIEKNQDAYVQVGNVNLILDKRYGTIKSLCCNNVEFLCTTNKNAGVSEYAMPISGPRLNFWRAPAFSDAEIEPQWRAYGYDCLETHINKAIIEIGEDELLFKVNAFYGAKAILPAFEADIVYRICNSGLIDIEYKVKPLREDLPYLARLGLVMDLSYNFKQVEYYGKGPLENYPDMQEASRIGLFSQRISKLGEIDILPQEMGNRSQIRWCAFCSKQNKLTVFANEPFNMNAHHYSQEILEKTTHIEELKHQMLTQINLDSVIAPIGQWYCGYPKDDMRFKVVPNQELNFKFTFVLEDSIKKK